MRKGSSGTDKSPRSANIAHIQLGAVVCAWWCLFTASINVMAQVALTHRTGRCSKLLAPFHNATTDRATRSQRSMDTQVTAAAHGASHTTCLVLAEIHSAQINQGSEDLARTLVCAPAPCHTVVSTRSTVYRDPQSCSRDIEDGLWGGRWVAAQKHPQQHLAGETSLLGATRSPTAVARAPWHQERWPQSARNFGEYGTLDIGPPTAHAGRSNGQYAP